MEACMPACEKSRMPNISKDATEGVTIEDNGVDSSDEPTDMSESETCQEWKNSKRTEDSSGRNTIK
jgi:hypothetical protein